MIDPNAAGIDVASEEMWGCVPPDRAKEKGSTVRKFGAFTCDLHAIADWLTECGVTTVAMESTGIYWIPLYQVLETSGFTVCLVNARQMKNVAGRPKTDRLDCRWIQRLHSYGLLMPSFRPPDEICHLRSLLRHREALIRGAARHTQHMQKALHQMNLLLDKVISDIMGVTGTAIIEQILAGERDPVILAGLRDCRIRASEDDIVKALQGDYRKEHLFVLQQAYEAYQFAQTQIAACDREVEAWLKQTEKAVDIREHPLPSETGRRKKARDNEPTYDARSYVYEIYGVDVTQIPGIQAATVQLMLAEVGRDLTKWPTEKHFTSWLGLCPNFKRSGGKDYSSQTRKVQSRAAKALRIAARTLRNSKSALGAFYRRLKGRIGPAKALTATARKLAVIFYNMVTKGTSYTDLGEDYYVKKQQQRHLNRLTKQAKLLGFDLVPHTTPSGSKA
ncbi:MAG: IS110 family transposase [bacterium]|nr:IS110 family transposase [bacterium]